MPQFILDHGAPDGAAWFSSLPEFDRGYVEAMFFTSCGPDDEELEGGTVADLAPETRARIVSDCPAFTASIRETWIACQRDGATGTEEQAGRDFWFTRNGHGVGFWDREPEVYGEGAVFFTERAEAAGSVDLYRGDDQLLYLM